MGQTYSIPEFRQRLAKHIEGMIDRVADDIQDLAKREQIKKNLWEMAHAEPGQHEPPQAGVEGHMEPGGHEQFALNPPAGPTTEQEVGGGNGVPPGQLGQDPNGDDQCPLCGKADMPGSCCCLDNYVLGKSEVAKNFNYTPSASNGPQPMAMNEMCKSCGSSHTGACKEMEKAALPANAGPSNDPLSVCASCGGGDEGPEFNNPMEPCAGCGRPVHRNACCADLNDQMQVICESCNGMASPSRRPEDNPGVSVAPPPRDVIKGEFKDRSKKADDPTNPKACLPEDEGGEKCPPSKGSGGQIKETSPLGKTDVPTAKPPSGKIPGQSTPPMASNTSKPGLAKAALPAGNKQMMQTHALADAAKAAGKGPGGGAPAAMAPSATKTLTNPNDMTRANTLAAAGAGAFKPTGPVSSGLELAPKAGPMKTGVPGPTLTPPPAGVREAKPAVAAPGGAPKPMGAAPAAPGGAMKPPALPKPGGPLKQ